MYAVIICNVFIGVVVCHVGQETSDTVNQSYLMLILTNSVTFSLKKYISNYAKVIGFIGVLRIESCF